MSDPSLPPRPSLRESVFDFIGDCVWNQQKSRAETTAGAPVFGWLNQTGTPTMTATVQWEAGTSTDLGDAVPATIEYGSWNIIKNGSYDQQTGLVTYNQVAYRFSFEMVQGTATMAAYG
jgi:hypothetical protein